MGYDYSVPPDQNRTPHKAWKDEPHGPARPYAVNRMPYAVCCPSR